MRFWQIFKKQLLLPAVSACSPISLGLQIHSHDWAGHFLQGREALHFYVRDLGGSLCWLQAFHSLLPILFLLGRDGEHHHVLPLKDVVGFSSSNPLSPAHK